MPHIFFFITIKNSLSITVCPKFSGLNLCLSLPAFRPTLVIPAVLCWEIVRRVDVVAQCSRSAAQLDEHSLLTLSEESAVLVER